MLSRSDIVAEARKTLGTRYHHLGRSPGAALDCVGVVVTIARKLDLSIVVQKDVTGYPKRPVNVELLRACSDALVSIDEPRPGSVGAFWITDVKQPTHLAVFAEHPTIRGALSMIHAYAPARRVTENIFDEYWRYRLAAVYDFPGVV